MPNDPANDRYNPPGTSANDFNTEKFSDIPEHDLFWLNTNRTNNQVYRKTTSTHAMNLKTRELVPFERMVKVFQKI